MSARVCVDASVAAKWLLPEAYSAEALALLQGCRSSNIANVVPPHFPGEVVNIIRRRVARGLLTHAEG
ncbi:MAG: type II toxin-antitoxin system VapC family toxin [Chloroflexi bacterium]|nr:type II toxin-antitoxin system VapC family toxin [Chloroflexota bacterium]